MKANDTYLNHNTCNRYYNRGDLVQFKDTEALAGKTKHRMARKLYGTVAAILLLCLVSGCRGDEPKRIPDTMPDVYGTITSITTEDDDYAKAVVMVQTMEGVEARYPNANISIDDETLIEDSNGKRLKLEHLQKGQEVQAWFEGDVVEEIPVQGYVKAVRVKAQ